MSEVVSWSAATAASTMAPESAARSFLPGDHREPACAVEVDLGGRDEDFSEIKRPALDRLSNLLHHQLRVWLLPDGQRRIIREYLVGEPAKHLVIAGGDQLETVRSVVWINHTLNRTGP